MHYEHKGMKLATRGFGALLFANLLVGCAAVPRGPAASLADAGIATTNAFSTEVRQTASQIKFVDVTDSFVATYDLCRVNPSLCGTMLQQDETYQKRLDLAKLVELRASAIDALGDAYRSLKKESDYDARADLESATNSAVKGVNTFAAAALAAGGAAPAAALITEPLAKIASLGAGLFADAKQRDRIIRGSQKISEATKRLRDALEVELFVFDSIAEYLERNRTSSKIALINSGIASNNEIIQPMITSLGLKTVIGVDAVIAKSPATQMAVQATIAAQSRAEIQRIRNKYRASINALDALVEAHGELENEQGVSLADVERFLGELDVALITQEKEL